MTTFVATDFREIDGRERTFGVQLKADDWSDAERICDQEGWRLDGELVCEVFAWVSPEEVDAVGRQIAGGLN